MAANSNDRQAFCFEQTRLGSKSRAIQDLQIKDVDLATIKRFLWPLNAGHYTGAPFLSVSADRSRLSTRL